MKAVKSSSNNNRRSLSRQSIGASSTVGSNAAVNKHPPISLPTTVELRGVPIHFPFQPYPCQRDYMETVLDALFRSENALLESPTGTGKTLCLLCATLAWQREEARKLHQFPTSFHSSTTNETNSRSIRRVPTIIYASRTHSQLSQVVRELRNTRYRPKHAVLGSREQMCVNPKVKRASSTGTDINHDCNRLGQERKCHFRNKLDGFVAPSNEASSTTQSVRDMEDLVQLGHDHRICPFYYTRSLVEDAELILIPYNYLFDKDSRTTTLADVPWKNAVVIFDEAHNLESFASESASFDLTTTDLAGCINEIQRAVNYVQTFGGAGAAGDDGGGNAGGKLRPENIAKLKSMFLRLEEYLINTLSAQAMSYKGEFMMELFQKGCGITHANHELFVTEVRKLTDVFLQFGTSSKSGGGGGGAPRLEHFIQCVKRVFGEPTEARCFAKAQSYRVHITQKQMQPTGGAPTAKGNYNNNTHVAGRTVSYWCFAPSEAMRELANLQVRSILVTSGTLSPLESYALELDLPFPHRLENPHIIPDDQIHVRIVGKGVSQKLLSSAYERRQNDEYYTELGNTLVSLGKIIPGGMLIFFPSYGVMETCLEKWGGPAGNSGSNRGQNGSSSFFAARKRKATGSERYSFPHAPYTYSSSSHNEVMTPWKRLLGVKAVVVEPKSSTDLPDAIAEFHKYLNLPKSKGVVLMGVCRGKISEGIDFAHEMCRAVVITGLPFAPSFDPKVKMKREFLDQNRSAQTLRVSTDGGFGMTTSSSSSTVTKAFQPLGLSGHEWYTQQAHRAVNQAIGRVIRNKHDYGAVLLLDNRFSLPGNQQGLSKWVRPHILPDEGMGRTIGALSRFYKEAALKAEERGKEAPQLPAPNPVSIILRYEDEEEGNTSSKQPREDNPGNTDEDETAQVTRIAYVETNYENGENPSATNQDNSDHQDSGSSYIRPDRIIGRVDLNGAESAVPSPKTETTAWVSTEYPALSVGSRKISSEGFKSSTSQASLSPAQRFFMLVQQRMTSDEQSVMRRAAVAMKPVNGKYRGEFAKAAQSMIRIILSYEPFEGRSQKHKPELIELLMQLFPKNVINSMRALVILMIFDGSKFAKWLNEKLGEEKHLKARSNLKSLLVQVWFQNEDGIFMSAQAFLSQLESCLSAALGSIEVLQCSQDLVQLLPLELQASTTAFIDQEKANLRILELKAKEKTSVGESSIDDARFRAPTVKLGPVPQQLQPENTYQAVSCETACTEADKTARVLQSEVNPYVISSQRTRTRDSLELGSSNHPSKKPATNRRFSTGLIDQKEKMSNPYARKSLDGNARPTKVAKVETGIAKPAVRGVLSNLLGSSTGTNVSDNSKDPIRKALDEMESDIYTGQKCPNMRHIVSNAPKDWTCQVCETASEQLFIALCHHVSCKTCWVSWLKKSPTCPHCRKPTSIETLALVVFKELSQNRVPGQS